MKQHTPIVVIFTFTIVQHQLYVGRVEDLVPYILSIKKYSQDDYSTQGHHSIVLQIVLQYSHGYSFYHILLSSL